MRTVLIIVFDGVQSLDVTGPLEVFAHAASHDGSPAYRVRTAGLGGAAVRSSSGLSLIPDDDLAAVGTGDLSLLLVPGGEGARRRPPELVQWLREHAPRAPRVASVVPRPDISAQGRSSWPAPAC